MNLFAFAILRKFLSDIANQIQLIVEFGFQYVVALPEVNSGSSTRSLFDKSFKSSIEILVYTKATSNLKNSAKNFFGIWGPPKAGSPTSSAYFLKYIPNLN